MTAEEVREEVFGDLVTVSGYVTYREPITGSQFVTFSGVAVKPVGEPAAVGSVQPTEAEALRVHVEALKAWLSVEIARCKRPVVCVRMWPTVERLSDGRWLARTRLLVTEGDRDVSAVKVNVPLCLSKADADQPFVSIRGLVAGNQPVVGVIQ